MKRDSDPSKVKALRDAIPRLRKEIERINAAGQADTEARHELERLQESVNTRLGMVHPDDPGAVALISDRDRLDLLKAWVGNESERRERARAGLVGLLRGMADDVRAVADARAEKGAYECPWLFMLSTGNCLQAAGMAINEIEAVLSKVVESKRPNVAESPAYLVAAPDPSTSRAEATRILNENAPR